MYYILTGYESDKSIDYLKQSIRYLRQIKQLTRQDEILEKEVKDFVEYKLSTYKVANPTKRSDLVPKSIYAFDIPNEIARVKRYKEYAEYCLKQLEQMQKEG